MLRNNNLDSTLFHSIKHLIEEAQKRVVRNINTEIVVMYFEIGRQIVQEDQMGKIRADYAKSILGQLSKRLTEEFGRGYSVDNLENCRRFYLAYEMRISETVSRKSETPPSILGTPFLLSWSHYVQLIKIQNSNERQFYEIEAHKNNWSLRELQRQINSSLYERVALSKDKDGLERLSKEGQIIELPTDVLKSHYVLEFLDLKEDNRYSESDLETAIINKLEHFMLEMGKGFLFRGRLKTGFATILFDI